MTLIGLMEHLVHYHKNGMDENHDILLPGPKYFKYYFTLSQFHEIKLVVS